MSNKSQLQTNNIDLQSILSTVLGLPTQESCKNGAYVWKKYNYSIKPSIVANNKDLSGSDGFYIYNSDDYQVTSSDFSLSILDGGQTVGTSRTIYFTYTDKLYWSYTKGGTDDYQYRVDTNSDNLLIVANNYSCNFTGLTSIKFTEPSIGDFVEFVVSDSETAYPDGAVHTDGYWYEKVVEGVDLLLPLGCTKIAVDKFTFTSNTALRDAGEISHSLGEIPKVAIILSTLRSTTTANHIIAAILLPSNSGYFTCPLLYTTTTAESYSSGTLSVPRTASAIGPVYASQYFTGGVEYTLITMV